MHRTCPANFVFIRLGIARTDHRIVFLTLARTRRPTLENVHISCFDSERNVFDAVAHKTASCRSFTKEFQAYLTVGLRPGQTHIDEQDFEGFKVLNTVEMGA